MTDILSLGASTIYMDIIIRVLLIIILILGIIHLVKLIFKKQQKIVGSKRRKILAIALSIIISTTITITSTGIAKVYAETTSEQPDIELIERICATGVSEETAYRLAQKVEAGGMLDSMNPQYKDMAPTFENDPSSGATPQAVFVVPAIAWVAATVHIVVVGTVAVFVAAGCAIVLGAAVYTKVRSY